MASTKRSILVCLDGSEPAQRALELCLQIAKSNEMSIQILSVLDLYEVELYENLYFSREQVEEMRKKRHAELVAPACERVRNHEVAVHGETSVGRPVKQILHFVETHRPEWVAVGRSGRGRVERIFEGSVSRGLAAKVSVPIFIVP